ncbi:MAG: polymerase subunit sigma-24 [Rariglobus sp.]|jgi:RNA polymerase sigma-70 factor (ECF subfamily)|nr:polymerase subunit sigma-24 [Rariglobus sp.]
MISGSPQPTDESLASGLREGDDTALDALMLRWQVPLRSFLYRHTQNEADALDLAQETFVRIYQHRARYREGARFSTWMFQIALNLARDHARRRTRRPLVALDEAPEPADTHGDPQSESLAAERASAVRTAIATLPDNLRAPLVLSEYENMSHADIAAIVRATPKAVETRLARARDLLRKKLTGFLG